MAQAVSIKQEELKNISRIMMQRKGDAIKIHHYPEFHLFFAFDPVLEKNLHVMDINTVGPMIDYYLGDGYRITEIKRIDGMGLFDALKKQADDEEIVNELKSENDSTSKPSDSIQEIRDLFYSRGGVNEIYVAESGQEFHLKVGNGIIEGLNGSVRWSYGNFFSYIENAMKEERLENITFHFKNGQTMVKDFRYSQPVDTVDLNQKNISAYLENKKITEKEIIEHALKGNVSVAMKMISSVLDDRNTTKINVAFFVGDTVCSWLLKRRSNKHWSLNGSDETFLDSILLNDVYVLVKDARLCGFKIK